MFRFFCPPFLFVLLSGVVHADVLLSTPSESYIVPTSPKTIEKTETTGVTFTTQGYVSTETDSTTATQAASTTSAVVIVTSEPSTTSQTSTTSVTPTTQTTSTTTETPTTHETNATTTQPTNVTTTTTEHTNATTVNPTNTTTISIPTTAVPTTAPLPNPFVGDYHVKASSGSECLKAKMGLQFRFNPGTQFESINLDPNSTSSNGSCGSNGTDSTLILYSGNITVQFTFANETNKFHLSGFKFSLDNGNGSIFSTENQSLSLWEASLGSSYMCRKEQSYNISDNFILNTFELQVQPFGITDSKFSTAEDCQADEPDSFVIPIAVGVALIVLILIVLLAYFIGRKRSQTVAEECFLDADLSFLVPIAVGVALGFLIILVLISYLIGRRKSRTGYQSV